MPGLTRKNARYFWNDRPVDLHILWNGIDTYIDRADFDDEDGGQVPADELDDLNEQALKSEVFSLGKHG